MEGWRYLTPQRNGSAVHELHLPLRVVWLDHTAKLSGGELAMLRLLPHLPGVTCVVVLAEDGDLRPKLEAEGVRVVVLPMAARTSSINRGQVGGRLPLRAVWDTLRYVLTLTLWLRRSGADLVHGNSLKSNLYGSIAARLAGIPFVWHARDRIAADYMPACAVRLVRLAILVLPSAVIANSDSTRQTLGLPRSATVVGSPVVADAVTLTSAGPPAEHGPFTVAIVGRLAPWKGQDVVLRAFAAAFPDGDQRLNLVGSAMFGEDDYAASLELLATELGVHDRVAFRGFREDVLGEMAQADVIVHASVVPEPFGQVVIEAMAAGRPVIASNAGGPAEIVTDGVDGLLVPPGDVQALAAALIELHDRPDLAMFLAANGCIRSRDFGVDLTAAKVRAIYDTLVS